MGMSEPRIPHHTCICIDHMYRFNSLIIFKASPQRNLKLNFTSDELHESSFSLLTITGEDSSWVMLLYELRPSNTKRIPKNRTSTHCTYSVICDNYSTPTSLVRALARASTQVAPDSDEEDEMPNKFWSLGASGSNAAEPITVDLFGDEYIEPSKDKSHKRGPTTSQTDSGRSKRSRSSGFDDVCIAFTTYVHAKIKHSRAQLTDTVAVSAGGDNYSLDACQDAMLEHGDIPPVQYIKALTLFKDKEWRKFFMRTPAYMRLAMILVLQ
ncbi:hypothetical protein CsSME_00048049 [Camellia sinensis var. sinensis]